MYVRIDNVLYFIRDYLFFFKKVRIMVPSAYDAVQHQFLLNSQI